MSDVDSVSSASDWDKEVEVEAEGAHLPELGKAFVLRTDERGVSTLTPVTDALPAGTAASSETLLRAPADVEPPPPVVGHAALRPELPRGERVGNGAGVSAGPVRLANGPLEGEAGCSQACGPHENLCAATGKAAGPQEGPQGDLPAAASSPGAVAEGGQRRHEVGEQQQQQQDEGKGAVVEDDGDDDDEEEEQEHDVDGAGGGSYTPSPTRQLGFGGVASPSHRVRVFGSSELSDSPQVSEASGSPMMAITTPPRKPDQRRQDSQPSELDLPDMLSSDGDLSAPTSNGGSGEKKTRTTDRPVSAGALPAVSSGSRRRHSESVWPSSASSVSLVAAAAAAAEPNSSGGGGGGGHSSHNLDELAADYLSASSSFHRLANATAVSKLRFQLRTLPKTTTRKSFVGFGSNDSLASQAPSAVSGGLGEVEMDEDAVTPGVVSSPSRPVSPVHELVDPLRAQIGEDVARLAERVEIDRDTQRLRSKVSVAAGEVAMSERPFAVAWSCRVAADLPAVLREKRDPPLPLTDVELLLVLECLRYPAAYEQVEALRPRLPDEALQIARERVESLERLFSFNAYFGCSARPSPLGFAALCAMVRLYGRGLDDAESGLYRFATVAQHSCAPTCQFRVVRADDADDGSDSADGNDSNPDGAVAGPGPGAVRGPRIELVALVDLEPGDELTVSYFQGNEMFGRLPKARRQTMLNATGHGFVCQCRKCASS